MQEDAIPAGLTALQIDPRLKRLREMVLNRANLGQDLQESLKVLMPIPPRLVSPSIPIDVLVPMVPPRLRLEADLERLSQFADPTEMPSFPAESFPTQSWLGHVHVNGSG